MGLRSQPDYAVEFGRTAFSEEQLNKLRPFVGELTDTLFCMATYYIYFTFLTCETKCGAAALDIADRQNAHSMTLAVGRVVGLFKLVGREKELDRQVLASWCRMITQPREFTAINRWLGRRRPPFTAIPSTNSTSQHSIGKRSGRLASSRRTFTTSGWPEHSKRLCLVIGQLRADLRFELSEQSEVQYQDSRLSQELQGYALSQPTADSVSFQEGSQGSAFGRQDATPDTLCLNHLDLSRNRGRRLLRSSNVGTGTN